MPTFIMALLIVAALGLLASSLLSGRRDRDPSSSVHHFHRAMNAMSNATPPASSGGHDADADHQTEKADDAVSRA